MRTHSKTLTKDIKQHIGVKDYIDDIRKKYIYKNHISPPPSLWMSKMADISECFGHVPSRIGVVPFDAPWRCRGRFLAGKCFFFFSGPTGVPYFGMFKLP